MFGWFGKREKAVTIDTPAKLAAALRAQNMFAGVSVSPDAASRQATVFACIRVRGETFAQFSPVVYERVGDYEKRRADDHWLSKLLRGEPAEDTSPHEFLEGISNCLDLRGEYLAFKVRAGKEVKRFVPLNPDEVEISWDKSKRRRLYKTHGFEVAGKGDTFTSDDILHIPRQLDQERLRGLTPLTQCRHALGLTLAIERHGATVFTNGALPSGVIELPFTMDEPAYNRLQKSLDEEWNGAQANRTLIVESGGQFKPTGLINKDAEFLNSRKFQRNEICAVFRVPPHLVADLERSTFSNIEHQSLEWIMYGVMPDAARVESKINSTLLAGTRYYLEFRVESLIRGDYKTRMEGYQLAIQNAILTPDEVRAKENLPPIPGGKEAFMMGNVRTLRAALLEGSGGAGGSVDAVDSVDSVDEIAGSEDAVKRAVERVLSASRNGNGVCHGV